MELSRTSDVGRDGLKYIRTALNSDSIYTMDNRSFCAQRASMFPKQSTGRSLIVNDDAICSGVFHEEDDEQRMPKDTHRSPNPATSRQEEPTAIDSSTNFDVINGMKVLNCGTGTFNERFAIFMVKHYGDYVEALSAIAQLMRCYPTYVELNSFETVRSTLRFARVFVAHFGGYENGVRRILELQRNDPSRSWLTKLRWKGLGTHPRLQQHLSRRQQVQE